MKESLSIILKTKVWIVKELGDLMVDLWGWLKMWMVILNSHVPAKIKWQAKRRKSIPKWLATGNSDIVLVREDRGDSHVVCDLEFLWN